MTTELSEKQLRRPSCRRSTMRQRRPRQQGQALRAIGRQRSGGRAAPSTRSSTASGQGLIDGRALGGRRSGPTLRITRAALDALGVETEDDAPDAAAPARHGRDDGRGGARAAARAPGDRADGTPKPAKGKAKAKEKAKAKPAKAAPAAKPTPRAGTKQAQMIELLKRPEGATVEQIAEATGWQHHTIRGAISGALKKKLGLNVEATRTREVGPEKTGAKGSSTVYRIVG